MRVLIFTSDRYSHLGFSDLPGTIGDASLWRRYLSGIDHLDVIFCANPDRAKFFSAISEVQPDVVIYSGHGVRVRTRLGYVEALALAGARSIERISNAEIASLRHNNGIAVFLDCCHAAGVLDTSRSFLETSDRHVGDEVPEGARSIGVIDEDDDMLEHRSSPHSVDFQSSYWNNVGSDPFAFASAQPDEYAWETRSGDKTFGLATMAVLASATLGLSDQTRLRSVMRAYGHKSKQSTPVATDIGAFGKALAFTPNNQTEGNR